MIPHVNKENGFTLIERIVVIVLISIFLTFAVPHFRTDFFINNTGKTCRWITAEIDTLRERAIRNQKTCTLHLGIDSGRFWVTDESMSEEAMEALEQKGYAIPADIKLLDVAYPDSEKIETGTAAINFYKKGYTDKALIHLEDADNSLISLLVEPFLDNVKIYKRYAGFED